MWQSSEDSIVPRTGDVDLWRVALDRDPTSINALFELLSADEKARANKYVFAKDKRHFIAGRGALRKIIGGYLDVSPEEIRFSTNRFGKPFLSTNDRDLRFNVSHACGIGVVAVSFGRELGVDIEFVDRNFDVWSVAASVLSPAEFAQMRSLASSSQAAMFFAGWTRKEAFLKAMGDGLSSSDELQRAVSLIGDKGVFRSSEENIVTDWSLTSFEIHKDFKASLVVEGSIGSLKFWQLDSSGSRENEVERKVAHGFLTGRVGEPLNVCAE